MKLVEILARELKEWPESVKGITQGAIDGELYFDGPEFIGSGIFLRPSQDCISVVTRAQWQEARDALNKPAVEEWNGEGLPPVGLPVEWYSDSNTGWQEIVVLAYHGDDAWIQPKGKESTIVYNIANFRPIRTPEQIAAEEREKSIRELIERTDYILDETGAAAVLAAGYRKPE